ncbi:MaoC/PaaZ C-terminal domain-containing protein [soil metagenome]
MPLNPDRLLRLELPPVEQSYDERDVILHALSVGFDPADPGSLDFVYEKALKASPTMALTLCHRSIATMDLGIDYRKVVHAAQQLRVHAALPISGTAVAHSRISGLWDLGERKGALLEIEKRLIDKATGVHIATSCMTALCRGDGGFGGETRPQVEQAAPSGEPDKVCKWLSSTMQAALYRLQGDMNPLHIDPAIARAVGFERPILHGLATFGATVRALLAEALDHDPERLASIEGRFTAPFYPGELVRVEFWTGEGSIAFRAVAEERDVVVIKDGIATLK